MKIDDIRTHIIGKYGIANSNRYQISFIPGVDLGEWLSYSPSESPLEYDKQWNTSSKKAQLVSWLADDVQLPGYNVATGDLKGYVPGLSLIHI